jgi:hypothetical protein
MSIGRLHGRPGKSSQAKGVSSHLLGTGYCEEVSGSDREEEFRRHWNGFLDQDLPQLIDVLKEDRWIWSGSKNATLTSTSVSLHASSS